VRITTDKSAIMQNIKTWSDDHLPCVSFDHNNVNIEVWWTEKALAGRLEMVEEGDTTLGVALKKWPDLLSIINNPFDTQESDTIERVDERDIDGDLSYNIDIGYVKITPLAS
jgi:hypothetical protein